MFTKAFGKDVFERAIKSFAGTVAVVLAAGEVVNVFTVDWTEAFGLGAGHAVVSVLMSVASYKAGKTGTASAVKEVAYDEVPHRAL